MDSLPEHNYSNVILHERLSIVPDIDEEEEEDVFVNCGDGNINPTICQSLIADSSQQAASVQPDHVGVFILPDENKMLKEEADSSDRAIEMTLFDRNHHENKTIYNSLKVPTGKLNSNVTNTDSNINKANSSIHKINGNVNQAKSSFNTTNSSANVTNSNANVTNSNEDGTGFNHVPSPQDRKVADKELTLSRRSARTSSSSDDNSVATTESSHSHCQTGEDTTALLLESEHPHLVNASRHSSVNSRASSTGSVDGLSAASSISDFRILKSAMKRSCEDHKNGKRRLSLFNQVMRRVSIHRRESTPTGRIATFLFGVEDMHQEKKDDEEKGETVEHKDVEDNGGHFTSNIQDKKAAHRSQLRESLFLILSGLYGLIIVILGVVIPITEIFMPDSLHRPFEAFYVYLYVVSVLFLGYVYAYLLRRNRLKTEFLTRTLSRSLSWKRAWGKTWNKGTENFSKGKLRKRMISLDVSNHHTGTFYLRLGVLGFGIGSMIHSGLKFGTFISVPGTSCKEPFQAIKPLIHLVFTFFQLYFIFMNSKSIVVETLHVIHSQAHGQDHSQEGGHTRRVENKQSPGPVGHASTDAQPYIDTTYLMITTSLNLGRKLNSVPINNETSDVDNVCQWSDMMTKAVEAAGPYLYPCTIEYSLMCAGILYIMWKNVGKRPRLPRVSEIGDDEDDQHVHRMSVDCTGSNRGLFLGILLMVGTIISIIAFYMLNNVEENKLSGIILTHLSETVIYLVTLIALFMAAYRMKALTFHGQHEADLEDVLILISYTGLLLFIIFSLVASILSKPDTKSGMTIMSNIVMFIQSTVQTIFILAGDRMSASTEAQERKKPGREFITFLLISNFAMWAINTFETQTPQHNPVQVDFYGQKAWAIFTHISVPLGIYYRFHSTVCFSNIWKNAWKQRKH